MLAKIVRQPLSTASRVPTLRQRSHVRYASSPATGGCNKKHFMAYLVLMCYSSLLLRPLSQVFESFDQKPEPHWNLLLDDIFSKTPEELTGLVMMNKGNGVTVHVIDSGDISPFLLPALKSTSLSAPEPRPEGATNTDQELNDAIHGNMVISRIVGLPSSLAPEAFLHYHQISSVADMDSTFRFIEESSPTPALICMTMGCTIWQRHERILYINILDSIASICNTKGIPLVVAGGNSRQISPNSRALPVCSKHAWVVGNLQKDEDGNWKLEEDSARGSWIKFVAPGTDVPVHLYHPTEFTKGETTKQCGTSFAAPAAAAYMARLMSLFPWMNRSDVDIALSYIAPKRQYLEGQEAFESRCLILE